MEKISFLQSFNDKIRIIIFSFLLLIGLQVTYAEDLEVTGAITQIGSDWVVVQGYTFFTDQNTELRGPNGNAVPFSFFQLNDFVQVKGNNRGDGTYLATRLKWEDNPTNPNEIELTGYVTSKGTSSFEINGTVFLVDANTVYRGRHDNPFSFEMIQVGMLLEVKAILQSGNLLAIRVKTEDDHNNQHGNELEIKGFIDTKLVNSITIGQHEFFVNSQTIILNRNNVQITFAQLNVGDFVEVKSYRQSDSTYIAVRIKLEDISQNQIEIKAKIESIIGNDISVGGITFNTDSNTVFLDNNRMPTSLSFFTVGMLVEVKGFKRQDGSHYATQVKMEDFINNEVEVRGTISELSTNSITVAGVSFDVDNSTQVFDHQNNPISYSSLQAGQLVEVKGIRTSSNTIKVVRIKLENNEGIEIFGKITAINIDNIQVNGLTIFVNSDTVYFNHANQPISFSDLSTDHFVEVRIMKLPNNNLLALRVKIEDSRNFSKVSGYTGIISGNSVQLPTGVYNITNQTVIVDLNFNFINVGQLSNGQPVILWADGNSSTNKNALQIRMLVSSPTDVKENPAFVEGYYLEQNYPNPFNPSTRISFTIPETQQVILKVYNSLGEEISTLINSNLEKGNHTVQFDAAGLSSGLYLYRLESGNQLLIRKMMLLK